MYKDLIKKQFSIDFNLPEEAFQHSVFSTYQPDKKARYWARGRGEIICYQGRIFCRTENPQLTQTLASRYQTANGAWFFEMKNLIALSKLLKSFNLQISHSAPFFIPRKRLAITIEQDAHFQFYDRKSISEFKSDLRINQAFCYLETDPDQIGLGYVEDGLLKAICGANQNGQHTWEIGIEILEKDVAHRGIATTLVQNLTAKIQQDHPGIMPLYSTQFSHIRSMNVAISAGFKIGWTELTIDSIE